MSAGSTKVVFRARTVDPNKRLSIRIRKKCRNSSPKVKRAVTIPQSGMEKEEEMELDLQKAILSQKATSAGDSTIKNASHLIPTPKFTQIDEKDYERVYGTKRASEGDLIVFRDTVQFFVNQFAYDVDSEDEEWLAEHKRVSWDEFEQIIEKLEVASQNAIVKPRNAKILLRKFDPGIVDDVYDYWLQKRKLAASTSSSLAVACCYSTTNNECPSIQSEDHHPSSASHPPFLVRSRRCPVLIPRCLEYNRRAGCDEKQAVSNPYIAFRRRADKVLTRKKQKTEVMTYEKMLRLNFALKRSLVLADTLVQRERLKLAILDCDQSILNQEFTALPGVSDPPTAHPLGATPVPQIVQRNDHLWEAISPLPAIQAASSISVEYHHHPLFGGMSAAAAALAIQQQQQEEEELEKLIINYNTSSRVDGRYEFKRKADCLYRAPVIDVTISSPPPAQWAAVEPGEAAAANTSDGDDDDDYHNCLKSLRHFTGGFRRRIGRGGRVLIDLIRLSPKPTSP